MRGCWADSQWLHLSSRVRSNYTPSCILLLARRCAALLWSWLLQGWLLLLLMLQSLLLVRALLLLQTIMLVLEVVMLLVLVKLLEAMAPLLLLALT